MNDLSRRLWLNISVLATLTTLAALGLPAIANASDFCVLPASGCVPANTFAASAAGVQAALDAAGAQVDADRIILGAQTYTAPSAGFVYFHPSAPVELFGQGATTTLAAVQGSGTTLTFDGGSTATVRDMTIALPYRTSGGFPAAIVLTASTGRHLTVVPDPTAPVNTYGSNAVNLNGATFEHSTIALPLSGHFAGIGTTGPGNTVTDTSVTAGLPVNITADNANLTALRVVGGPGNSPVAVRGSGVNLTDSTIVGSSNALTASAGNGTDAALVLDHDTIISDGSSGTTALEADASVANGKSASITLRNSIIVGYAHALLRVVTPGGGAATVTTSFSDYDPSGDETLGSGGSGGLNEGAGNINQAPVFADPSGDYRLTALSPGLDAGDPSGLQGVEPATDLAGLPRIVDAAGECTPRSDMGAYELQTPPALPTAHAALTGTATAGVPAHFTAAGSTEPHAGALTYGWVFDDGGSATGAAPAHSFGAAGTHTATVSVTNACGRVGTAATSFAVASAVATAPSSGTPPPVAPPVAPPVVPPVVAASAISRLNATPSRFRVATGQRRHGARGTTLRFLSTGPASVTLTIARTVRSRNAPRRCVTHRCTTSRTVATIVVRGHRGSNLVWFSGRVHGQPLAAGSYGVEARLRGAPAARVLRTRFTVLSG